MNQLELSLEIIATYRKHGWQLRRVLMTSETRTEAGKRADKSFENVRIDDALIDALWFSRTSHENREAWELRPVAETAYALFELFEADKSEEQREEVRREMEARMRDYLAND